MKDDAEELVQCARFGEVEELEALLTLQERDLAVLAADGALGALEPEVRALDDQLAGVERELAAARRAIEAARTRRESLEGKIASYRNMQEQRRQRLEWVRGAKEASTLMAELDLTRTVLAKEEAEFLRSRGAVARYTVEQGQPHRLDTLAGPRARRLFDGFDAARKGCSR